MRELDLAKEILISGGYTCVLIKDKSIFTSTERGVKPLVEFYESGREFTGYFAADKVVGKATAFLYALMGVKALYAMVLSRSALEVLCDNGVEVEYGALTEYIVNRKGDGPCPFEVSVSRINDKESAYIQIKSKMKEMNL